MTLEMLIKHLESAESFWDLNRVGVPAIVDGLKDALKRIQALEKQAKK